MSCISFTFGPGGSVLAGVNIQGPTSVAHYLNIAKYTIEQSDNFLKRNGCDCAACEAARKIAAPLRAHLDLITKDPAIACAPVQVDVEIEERRHARSN